MEIHVEFEKKKNIIGWVGDEILLYFKSKKEKKKQIQMTKKII